MASWPAPPLRSAFAKTAAAGATGAAAEAAAGGEDATATARPATASAAVSEPAEAAPRRHDSAEGGRARRAPQGLLLHSFIHSSAHHLAQPWCLGS